MLNKEQSKMVEDNYKLVYSFIYRKGLDISDWHGLICEALIKSAITYKKECGAFSTYFNAVANNAFINEYRKCSKDFLDIKNVSKRLSLEYEESIIERDIESSYIDIFEGRLKVVADLLIKGYNQSEISKILQVSHTTISRDVKKIREKIKESE